MAIRVHDVLIRIRSDFEGARGFSRARSEIEGLGEAAEQASKEASALFQQARRLSKEDIAISFDLQGTKELLKDLEAIDKELSKVQTRRIGVDPAVRKAARERQADIQDQIAALREVTSETEKAMRIEARAQQDMQKLRRTIRRYEVIEEKKALSEIQKARKAARVADLKDMESAARARAQVTGRLMKQDLSGELRSTSREVGSMGRSLTQAASTADNWGSRLDSAAGILTRLTPILRGVSLLIGVSMVGAIGALVASLGAAVGGVVALGAAFTAALGPIMALFTGFMSRIAAVMQALKARQDAAKESAENQAQAAKVQAEQADRVRSAVTAQRDAMQGLERANEQAAQAADRLREAEVDALREIEDAAERASDAVLDLRDAQLGVADAQLNLQEAELALREFGKEAGLTDDKISDLFEKFENVDLRDTSKLKKLLSQVGKDAPGAEGLDLQRLLLDVARARLGVEQANERVSDSERDLTRAQQEHARLQREGIKGTQTYISALEALRDANRGVRDAQQRVNEANRDYKDTLAERAEALQGNQTAMQEYERQLGDLSDAERRFLGVLAPTVTALKNLVQQGTDPLFDALSKIIPQLSVLGPAIGTLFERLGTDAANNLQKLVDQLLSLPNMLKALQLGDLSGDMANQLGGPILRDAVQSFINIATGAAPMLREQLARLTVLFSDLRRSTEGFGKGTGGFDLISDALNAWLDLLINIGAVFVGFVKAAGPAGTELVQWLSDGAGALAEWLNSADGAERVGKFMDDAIPFAKALVKFLIKLGATGLEAFEALAPAAEKILDGMSLLLDVLDFLLEQFNRLPRVVRSIIGLLLPFGLALRGIAFVGTVGFRGVRIAIGALIPILGAIGTAVEWVLGLFLDLGEIIVGAFEDAVNWVKDFLGIASPSKLFMDIGRDIMRGLRDGIVSMVGAIGNALWSVITGALRRAANIGRQAYALARSLVNLIVQGFTLAAYKVYALGRSFIAWIARGARRTFNRLFELGKSAIGHVLNGIRWLYTEVYSVGTSIVRQLISGIESMAGELVSAIKGLASGIVNTIKGALGIESPSKVMYGVGQNVMRGFINGLAWGAEKMHAFVRDKMGAAAMSKIGDLFSRSQWMFRGRDKTEDLFARIATPKGEGIPRYWLPITGTEALMMPAGTLLKTFLHNLGQEMLEHLFSEATGLAKGGLATGPTFAQIGEAGREAVLPLSRSVMNRLAGAIVAQMSLAGPRALAMPGGGAMGMGARAGGMIIERQEIHLPPAPGHDQMGDVRHQAAQFAHELRRRGGQGIGGGGVS